MQTGNHPYRYREILHEKKKDLYDFFCNEWSLSVSLLALQSSDQNWVSIGPCPWYTTVIFNDSGSLLQCWIITGSNHNWSLRWSIRFRSTSFWFHNGIYQKLVVFKPLRQHKLPYTEFILRNMIEGIHHSYVIVLQSYEFTILVFNFQIRLQLDFCRFLFELSFCPFLALLPLSLSQSFI